MITPEVFEDLIDKVLKDEQVEIKIDDSSQLSQQSYFDQHTNEMFGSSAIVLGLFYF